MGIIAIIERSMIIKRFIKTLPLLTGLLTVCAAHAQEYTYLNYDVKDGLAGSTVFDICQDKDGFLWFATEAGISRFDGTHFKNFNTTDGLPETEIIKLFADSKGRIWMAPFKNTICYYYNGKIHTQENDPILKKVRLSTVVHTIMESHDHNIGMHGTRESVIITADGEVEIHPFRAKDRTICFMRPNPEGAGFQMKLNDSCFLFTNNHIRVIDCQKMPAHHTLNSAVIQFRNKLKVTAEDFTPAVDNVIFSSTWDGTWMMDTTTWDRYADQFLKGKQVSHGLIDKEKNIWFTTLGEGVYKLASREFKTWYFKNNRTSEIFSLAKVDGKINAGTAFGRIYQQKGAAIDTLNTQKEFTGSRNSNSTNRVTCLKTMKDNGLLIGTDGFLIKRINGKNIVNYTTYAIKSLEEMDNGLLLVGTSGRTMLLEPKHLKTIDTLFHDRTTSVCEYNNEYYIGTITGLYILTKSKVARFMGDVYPALRQRISYFSKSPDGLLWVGTYGAGIICIKNGRVINHVTTENGLSSNICRTLLFNKNFLWVGTDKGINKINISQSPYPVTTYTTSDGLPTNIINAIYIDSNKIYVGSPAGLTYFDESKVTNDSKCNLRLLEVVVGNKPQPLRENYQIHYQENSLKISYAGLSFKSGGGIWYRYRLKGLSDTWDSTSQTVLEYPSIPPGKYEFELIAMNRKGIVSNPVKIALVIEAPFWQTWPFQLLVIASIILITWLLVAWRFRILRRREQERSSIQQKLNELEQMALRAQMNPHFIFNCLNSIQNFIITNDLEASNQYLSEFAHLVRQTLDNSEKSTISITNEIRYLKRYLELEMMRFGHSFSYSIEADDDIDSDLEHIPTMILQPYIENSIRHGIRYKETGGGRIEVKFKKSDDGFVCIIQDNGIGRKRAAEYKSQMHVEYQSKGMSLTAERINILNRQLVDPIIIDIIDLNDEANQVVGTKVILRFPHTIHFKPVKK